MIGSGFLQLLSLIGSGLANRFRISLLVGETNEDLEEINKGGAPLVDQDIPIEAAGSWWP